MLVNGIKEEVISRSKRETQQTTVKRQVSLNFLLIIDCFRQSVASWVPQT